MISQSTVKNLIFTSFDLPSLLAFNFLSLKVVKRGWSHLKDLSKSFQKLMNFNWFGSKLAVQ